ncbi:MAG: hypothetical protein KDI30_11175 [Pseudomonadales bacterium]|nr:hypothetical protein [Pseudomonadales bacterium]
MMNQSISHNQRQLARHGCTVLLLGLLAGIGFSYAAATVDTTSALYGNWKFAHLEGLVNGLMVLAIAGVWPWLERENLSVRVARWLLVLGAYANAIGPWITALFIGHRVIEPQTALEAFVVYGFYIPGVLPMFSLIVFVWFLWKKPPAVATGEVG